MRPCRADSRRVCSCFRFAGAGVQSGHAMGFATAPFGVVRGSRERATASRRVLGPVGLRAQAAGEEENLVEKYRRTLAELDSEPAQRARKPPDFFAKMAEAAKSVKTCQTDYDCNPGGRNYPLKCVNVVFASICVESDDDFQGGMGILQSAFEPIPVRVDDGYYGNGAQGTSQGTRNGQW